MAKKDKKDKKKKSIYSQLPKKKPAFAFTQPSVAAEAAALPEPCLPTGPPSLAAVKELFAAGGREAALSMLNELGEFSPEDGGALEELGHALMKNRDFDTAAAVHRKWSEADPASARAFNSLGASLISGGWLEQGQAALQKAVGLEPNKPIYQLNLAKLYMVRGIWESARSMLLNIMHSHPEEKAAAEALMAQFPEEEKNKS